MEIRYNVIGERRKELVQTIGRILDVKPRYLGMPTAAYEIDVYTVTKDGTLQFDDMTDSEEVEMLIDSIADAGFEFEAKEEGGEGTDESTNFTVEIPLDKVKLGNLMNLLDAKASLIKKALGVDDLRIEVKEDRVAFPWFKDITPEEAKAYTHLISAMCEMTREAKRVYAVERDTENEKYAFRCFLLRLGFIGTEYKAERKILLRNLSGSSAFRDGHKGGMDDEVSA